MKKYLCSPMARRPQRSTRLLGAGIYDAAFVLDPLTKSRAKGAATGDPLREGMIARNMLDKEVIQQQQQFAGILEA